MTTARTARGAQTLPQEYYVSQRLFDEELEAIFSRHWLYAAHLSELGEPGSYILFELGSESLIVVRGRDRRIRAFHNVCRHRGTRLCSRSAGRFAGAIQCPYHAWTYGLDGRLTGAPAMEEVEDFRLEDYPLHEVPTGTWEGLVFVNLAADAEPFDVVFAPLAGKFSRWGLAGLRSVHRTVYDVEANWKLLFQNYSECYHCPAAHPVLNRLTPYRQSWNDLDEGPFLGGPMKMARRGSMTMSGLACAPPLSGLHDEDLDLVYYYTIFPNLFLSLHPDYVLVHRSEALGPKLTRVTCDWYFDPAAADDPEFDAGGAVEFWDTTNRQDWRLCSEAQLGIGSRAYTPGPYAELESQLAAFDREYLRALGRL